MRLHATAAARLADDADDQVTDATESPDSGASSPADQGSSRSAGAAYAPGSRVRIPAVAWRTRRVNATARRAYCKIAKLSRPRAGVPEGGCVLSGEDLAEQLHVSPRTLDTALASLDGAGMIRSEARITGDGQLSSVRWANTPPRNPRGLWADIPVGVIDELSGHEFTVLCELMLRLTLGLPASRRDIGTAIGLTPARVKEYLDRLEERGLVHIHERAGRGGRDVFRARWSSKDAFIGQVPAAPRPAEGELDRVVEILETEDDACTLEAAQPSAADVDEPCDTPAPAPEVEAVCEPVCADVAGEAVVGEAELELPTQRGWQRPAAPAALPARTPAADPKTPLRIVVAPALIDQMVRQVLVQAGADLLARLGSEGRVRALGAKIAEHMLDHTDETPDRLAYRLRNAINRTGGTSSPDPFGWLLVTATRRQGCANPDCEDGRLWTHGLASCRACEQRRIDRGIAKKAAAERVTEPGSLERGAGYDDYRAAMAGLRARG